MATAPQFQILGNRWTTGSERHDMVYLEKRALGATPLRTNERTFDDEAGSEIQGMDGPTLRGRDYSSQSGLRGLTRHICSTRARRRRWRLQEPVKRVLLTFEPILIAGAFKRL